MSPDISATPGTQKYPSRWSDSRPRPSGDRRRPQSAGALTPSARRTATCRNSARKFPARSPARGDILRGWKVGVGVGVGGVVGVGGGVGGGGGGSSNGRGIDSLRASGRGPQLGKSNAPAKSTEVSVVSSFFFFLYGCHDRGAPLFFSFLRSLTFGA